MVPPTGTLEVCGYTTAAPEVVTGVGVGPLLLVYEFPPHAARLATAASAAARKHRLSLLFRLPFIKAPRRNKFSNGSNDWNRRIPRKFAATAYMRMITERGSIKRSRSMKKPDFKSA
jgi:hypothetical protein